MNDYDDVMPFIKVCGPSNETCNCQCPDGPCEHKWDGHDVDIALIDGGMASSVTCSRCEMSSWDHDSFVSP